MKVVFSGGGTGGHIYPALATIEAWQQQDSTLEVLYIGGERGLEKEIVPGAGVAFKAVRIQGFVRKLSLENFKTVYLFLQAVQKAKQMLRDFQPDVVVGTGGYVSGPVLYAAQLLKIPTVIHEQNSVVGITNKFLSRHVTKVGVAFPAALSAFKNATVVGNPRAQQVVSANGQNNFTLEALELATDIPTALIFGGSQGAPKINQAVVEALPRLNQAQYQVIFATGKNRYAALQDELTHQQITVGSQVKIVPYIANMQELMPLVDVVVGRAGATSLAEQTALGKPMILIPSPYVTNDHQTKNAQSMVDAGAAILLREAELNGNHLADALDEIMLAPTKQQAMAQSSAKLGIPDAANQFITLIQTALVTK